jgi:tripartite-type tricarboxylate transporter receptor subunit TctC
MKLHGLTAIAFAVAALAAAPAAQSADFYAGKTLTVVCPYPPGGTYDRMARLAAQFLPKHIPGSPSAIVQNKPGGGGMIGVRGVYRADPDGLTMLHFTSTTVADQATGAIKDIDFAKFNWLGSPGGAHYLFFMRSDRPERTIEQLKKAATPIRVASSGPASLLTQAAKFLQRAGKFNMRLVSGYKGYNPMALAVKQNEVDGVSTAGAAVLVNSVTRQMRQDGTIKLILSMGGAPPPKDLAAELASLPKFVDAIDDAKDRAAYVAFSGLLAASRPFVASPGVPADRVAILRKGMAAMMADPAFVKLATAQGFVLNTLDGAATAKLALSVLTLPADTRERLKALLK